MKPCPEHLRDRHNHDDPDVITFGCKRCRQRLAEDQAATEYNAAPLRQCRITFRDRSGNRFAVSRPLRCPKGWDPGRLEDWQPEEFGMAISDWCEANGKVFDHYLAAPVVMVTVGAMVHEVADAQPDLFGGTA